MRAKWKTLWIPLLSGLAVALVGCSSLPIQAVATATPIVVEIPLQSATPIPLVEPLSPAQTLLVETLLPTATPPNALPTATQPANIEPSPTLTIPHLEGANTVVVTLEEGGEFVLLPTLTPHGNERIPTPQATTPIHGSAGQPVPATLAEAEHLSLLGYWEDAASTFERFLSENSDSNWAARAELGKIRLLLIRQDTAGAKSAALAFLERYPTSPYTPHVHFLLADILLASEQNYASAFEHYQKVTELAPGLLDSYVYDELGWIYAKLDQPAPAVQAYEMALAAPRTIGTQELLLAYAKALWDSGNTAGALAQYEKVAADPNASYLVKAQMDFLRGRAHIALGQKEAGYGFYQSAVNNYPKTYDAFSAMKALLNAGFNIDRVTQAVITYHAGEKLTAVEQFLSLAQDDGAHDGRVHYYLAQYYREQGDTYNAEVQFREVLAHHNDGSALVADAWLELADMYWREVDNGKAAVQFYVEFADTYPQSSRAAYALVTAASIAERIDELALATDLWARAADDYPSSEEAPSSAFLAGISYYRQGKLNEAGVRFAQAATLSKVSAEQRAAAYLWVGKVAQAQGNASAAQNAWQTAQASNPGNYYALRAADLLAGRAPFTRTDYNLNKDIGALQTAGEIWLAAQVGVSPIGDWQNTIGQDARYRQAEALWWAGRPSTASKELRGLRTALRAENQPLKLYHLALACRELGDYNCTINATRDLLEELGLTNLFSSPEWFTYLRYAPYYDELVVPASERYEVDVLLSYALIRQESFFQSGVTSSAAAGGLMQIIPTTGDYIAKQLAWQNYQTSDLYRPYINVEFGTYYFEEQLRTFKGDVYASLAAYNAGPGNSAKWRAIAAGDPDLFLEVTRLEQPQRYIRRIYEYYLVYQSIYGQ
ncbi:MAG TPA: transglycosylase SLT domain-containing protein [Anaerolineales bacterium]|nr:transglycosylase SLT domain-containing protein [Anaerolineales bacterium]